MRFVQKRPSSCKVRSDNRKVGLHPLKAGQKKRRSRSVRKLTLKRPACGQGPMVPIDTTWRDFTPRKINHLRCLARTWDNGLGGQCERKPMGAECKLCRAHRVEDNRPQGLTHGLVTGEIPKVKLAEFQSVRAFRQRTQNDPSTELGHQQPEQVQVAKDELSHLIIPHHRPRLSFKGKMVSVGEFEQLALEATEYASEYLSRRVSYPLPIVGSLSCKWFGFENDLDGMRANTVCIFEWRFSYNGIQGLDATHYCKYKCRSLLGKRQHIQVPWQIRTMACLVDILVCLWFVCCNYCNKNALTCNLVVIM